MRPAPVKVALQSWRSSPIPPASRWQVHPLSRVSCHTVGASTFTASNSTCAGHRGPTEERATVPGRVLGSTRPVRVAPPALRWAPTTWTWSLRNTKWVPFVKWPWASRVKVEPALARTSLAKRISGVGSWTQAAWSVSPARVRAAADCLASWSRWAW